jgi:hypothetical protein
VYFVENILVEFTLVEVAKAIEALTADDFLFESFDKAGTFLGTNKHIDFVDAAH